FVCKGASFTRAVRLRKIVYACGPVGQYTPSGGQMSGAKSHAEILGELQEWLGHEVEFEGVDDVTQNDIRHKLEVYCFDCPLHWDADVAQAHAYRTVVAPVAMTGLWTVAPYWTPGEPPPFAPGLRERNGTRRRVELREPYSRG